MIAYIYSHFSDELMAIYEYCPYGNLKHILEKSREYYNDQKSIKKDCPHCTDPLTRSDLMCWAFQVARGMDYLASHRVWHGYLAASNILLLDNNVVKIANIGLSTRKTDYHRIGEVTRIVLKLKSNYIFPPLYVSVWFYIQMDGNGNDKRFKV